MMDPQKTKECVVSEREQRMEKKSRVCVTGAAGYIGSWLVKKLLERGHTVHATVRNIGDPSKTGLLKSLPGAEKQLFLFEADLYDPAKFEAAIRGCDYVFLVATPLQHNPKGSKYKNTTEAAVAAIQSIMLSCERSRSVKRVIYTGTVVASSPLMEDGNSSKDFINESCWTTVDLTFAHSEDLEKDYISSKTLSEKELLSYNIREANGGIEVVSLVCGLVGGDALLPYVPLSVQDIVSPLTGNHITCRQLKFLEGLLCSVPLVHIEDVCEAHVFCMERPSMAGRFLCASANPTIQELQEYYHHKYPELLVTKEVHVGIKKPELRSTKLAELGFKYKYEERHIIDGSVECAKRLGGLREPAST